MVIRQALSESYALRLEPHSQDANGNDVDINNLIGKRRSLVRDKVALWEKRAQWRKCSFSMH